MAKSSRLQVPKERQTTIRLPIRQEVQKNNVNMVTTVHILVLSKSLNLYYLILNTS